MKTAAFVFAALAHAALGLVTETETIPEAGAAKRHVRGGAGDHTIKMSRQILPPGVEIDLLATIDNEVLSVSLTHAQGLTASAETVTITPNFAQYNATVRELTDLFGTGSDHDGATGIDKIQIMSVSTPDEEYTNIEVGKVATAEALIFSRRQPLNVQLITCTEFLTGDNGTVTMTLYDPIGAADEALVTLKVGTNSPNADMASTHEYGGYTYSLTKTAGKCGFQYVITRPVWSVTICEVGTNGEYADGNGCYISNDGGAFDPIRESTFAQVSHEFNVDGWSIGELTSIAEGISLPHTVELIDDAIVMEGTQTTGAISGTLEADCDGELTIQQGCKYDELCYFKFIVDNCEISGSPNVDIDVTPYAFNQTGVLYNAATEFPQYDSPAEASQRPGVVARELMTFEAKEIVPDKQTTLRLSFPSLIGLLGDTQIQSFGNDVVLKVAQFRPQDEAGVPGNRGRGYEIIGYMKFKESYHGTGALLDVMEGRGGFSDFTIKATSMARITVR